MEKFYRKVDLRSRKAMVDFLGGHFRYYTDNIWNRRTSYANNVKVYNLGFTEEQENRLLDFMDCDDAYSRINDLISDFGISHDWQWQAGFNGRNGGYLVLYQGGQKMSEWKSYCTACGQRNFETVEESGCRCDRCGNDTRVNFVKPPVEVFRRTGQDVDMHEDFEDWAMEDLRERVRLVEEFDMLCDDIVAEAAWMADNMVVEEQEVMVPTTRKVLVEAAR